MNVLTGDATYFSQVQAELHRFEQLCAEVIGIYGGSQLLDDVYLLGQMAPRPGAAAQSSKKYPCVLGAITHGNEIAGLVSLNLFLETLSLHQVILDFPIVLILGNRKAALLGKRYVDADLNRSFALTPDQRETNCYEHSRAQELETVLEDTAYLMDLHQTIGTSPHGFYIFAYSQRCFHFSKNILPYQAIVTYWSGPYTTEGVCSDQFVYAHGGVAVTLELGTKGFNNYQAALGLQALLATQSYVRRFYLQNQPLSATLHSAPQPAQIYTWKSVVPYPATGAVTPSPHFDNFAPVSQGDVLGESSELGTMLAPADGLALFPSQIHSEAGDLTRRPHELIRILKPIELSELPDHPH